jgi:DNA-directed RNA polymerase subunit RPC12/RpoP
MPPLYSYHCDNCDFEISQGSGFYLYAIDKNGEEVVCPHPGEIGSLSRVLDISREEASAWLNQQYDKLSSETITKFEERVGQKYKYVCLDCFHENFLDRDREDLVCKECGSDNLKLAHKFKDKVCPKCNQGTVTAVHQGIS